MCKHYYKDKHNQVISKTKTDMMNRDKQIYDKLNLKQLGG